MGLFIFLKHIKLGENNTKQKNNCSFQEGLQSTAPEISQRIK